MSQPQAPYQQPYVPPLQPEPEPEREITFDQATQEQPAQNPDEQAAPAEDTVDILVPKKEPHVWKFGPNGELEYVQRPLSFFAKMQWFSLVGDVLDKALSGENAMSLNSLFDAPARQGQLSMADFRDADTFVQAVGKLLAHAPDFLIKSYCIWLNVPDYQRGTIADVMALPASEGGLSDEDGFEIIEVFIDQNYEALDAFFREHLARLQKRTSQRAAQASSSRQSKR